jgi:ribonuclease HII
LGETVAMTSPVPTFTVESRALAQGFAPVAGVDEAGRGPLAGPVVAAAVILDPLAIPPGLADSKVLDEGRREALYEAVMATALASVVASASPARIDATDIRKATLHAMAAAVTSLALAPRHVLVDGRDLPPLPLGVTGEAIVDGDALVFSIAAASILAKVHRDRLMRHVHAAHPAYGFAIHKGYGTKAHREAIAAHGPCIHHRMTFGSLKVR